MRFLLTIFCLSYSVAFCQNQWVLRKDADSIQVFTSHTDESKFKSIKALFTVNASLSQLAFMVWDVDRYDEWQYNTLNPKVLKRINEKEFIYYAEIEAPWPVSNRDMVVRLSFSQDPQTKVLIIDSRSEPSFIPPYEDIVRVPSSQARWTVTPISKSKLRVEYTIQIDPGGSVPAWMVNMVCAEAPYESFMNLRSMIAQVKAEPLEFVRD